MSKFIEIKDVSFHANNRTILNVSEFSLNRKEMLGIMGPNGAGKSTLVKILACLQESTTGEFYYEGKKIDVKNLPLDIRRKWAIVLQQSLIFDDNVFNNIAIGLKIRKVPKAIIKEKVEYWMDKLKITHLAKKSGHQLSGGEAQRVNLARALVLEPELLYLDEPFSALDYPTKVQLLKDLQVILKETSITIVLISHDINEIRFITDRLAVVVDGQIKQLGPTKEVLENPNEYTRKFLNDLTLIL